MFVLQLALHKIWTEFLMYWSIEIDYFKLLHFGVLDFEVLDM